MSVRLSDLTKLALCGVGSVALYICAFSLPYGIQGGLERPLQHFGRIIGPTAWPTVAYVGAVAALFAFYIAGLRICPRLERHPSGLALVVIIGALGALALLPMYPIFSLDIFYYMAADRIWSVYRENPFVVPPLQAAHDPFFPYTSWGHYTLPYGPLWPWISAITSAAGGGLIAPTLLAFKALGVVGYLACIPLVGWATAGLHADRRLLGIYTFAWNPLVLLELAGGGHNDAIALIPATVAVGLWTRRASIGTALALALSFTVKATVVVLAPVLLWASFRRAYVAGQVPRWALTHALPALALIALIWLPFWSDRSTGGLAREAEQSYQSLTAVLMAPIPATAKAVGLRALQVLLLTAFAFAFANQWKALSTENEGALRATWGLLVFYFAIVAPFYSPWYMMWPTLLAAVLAERRTTLLTILLAVGGLATYVVQFVVRPLTAPGLGWAQFNGLALLVAFGPFLVGWWLLTERATVRGTSVTPRQGPVRIVAPNVATTESER